MKNIAAASLLLLASSLDVAPRCGGCGASDREVTREVAREAELPAPSVEDDAGEAKPAGERGAAEAEQAAIEPAVPAS